MGLYRIYKFTNVATNKALTISGSNITSLSKHQNVVLSTYRGTKAQKWMVNFPGLGEYLRSRVDPSYALNVYRTGSPYNCDIYPISGNEYDATVHLMPFDYDETDDIYHIVLANYDTLYLTAGSDAEGANVYWSAFTDSPYQQWRGEFICYEGEDEGEEPEPPNSPESNALVMPVNLNQKYKENTDWVRKYGCSACCVADVASYYDETRNYSIQDMFDAGAVKEGVGVDWKKVPGVRFNEISSGNFLEIIKSEIDLGHPLVLYCKNETKGRKHYVVAFKYVNYVATNNDIYVLEPVGKKDSPTGQILTLADSIAKNNSGALKTVRKTSKK